MTADTIFTVFLYLIATGFTVALIFYPLWAVLHRILCRQLDPMLFRKPFFQETELESYQAFPLSLLKSINYIYLIAYPTLARRKRFRDLDRELPISKPLKALCKLHFSIGVLGLLVFIGAAIYLGVALLVI